MRAGEIECLGRGDTRDQAIGDVRRGGDGRRVFDATEREIAMNLVGHQNEIALGAEIGECTELSSRPGGAAGIVRAAQEHDLRSRC